MPKLAFVVARSVAFNGHIVGPSHALQGQYQAGANTLDAGLGTNPAFYFLNRADRGFTLGITNLGQDETEADGVIGDEAGIDILQTDETSNQQPGADHQDHRQRHLATHQNIAQGPAPARSGFAAISQSVCAG